MSDQDQIKSILFVNDKSKSWLAGKLNITPQKLDYILHNAKKISKSDYDSIMHIFKNAGFITSNSEQCNHLLGQTIEIDSLLGHALTILNGNIRQFTKDNVLDFNEKRRLLDIVTKIRTDFNNELDSIEMIIEGRTAN